MEFLNTAYLLLGGNVGDVRRQFIDVCERLNRDCGTIVACSAIYETAPWGNPDQPAFLNQALALETNLNAADLMKKLLDIEQQIGRTRVEKYGPRPIDIDILLFNEDIVDAADLKIPHPQLQHRLFALTPLADIAGDLMHPVLKQSVSELKASCNDRLRVEKVH